MHSFQECAQVLDSKRLNKQRTECIQIYNTLTNKSDGWKHHPAVLMWKGFEGLFCIYAIKICEECNRRGIKDNVNTYAKFTDVFTNHEFLVPPWWAEKEKKDKLIYTHRCNLLRKDYEYYKKFFPFIPAGEALLQEYYWPTSSNVMV